VVEGGREFIIAGREDVCWLLIHGYTSTPDEMRELAFKINEEFNETVVVPRLKGHGEVPSSILNLTINDWYLQIEKEYDNVEANCDGVNVVGFSFGGAIATRLAEEKEFDNLYLLAPYLKARYKWWRVLPSEAYLYLTADWTHYSKKLLIAQLNSQEGLEGHLAYWNMPFEPVKYSSEFFDLVTEELSLIEEAVLIQHSINDETADILGSEMIFGGVSSEVKDLIVFEESNHVLTEDFDKNEVMQNIINFERERRLI